jgi:hypothetical protein
MNEACDPLAILVPDFFVPCANPRRYALKNLVWQVFAGFALPHF